MAFCAHCGQPLPDDASSCPNCGHPNERLLATQPQALRYAGFWIRLLGSLIDGLILLVVALVITGGGLVRNRVAPPGTFRFRGVFTGPFDRSRIVGFVYQWLFLGLNDGRTPGCLVTGIRVARPDGSRIGLGTAAARQAMAIVSGIPLGLGFLWMLWDPEKRTWHDMVANTRVFKVR